MFSFQRSGDTLDDVWIVTVKARPFKGAIGSVHLSGRLSDATFDVWPQRHLDWAKKAERLLKSSEMWAELVVAREACLKEEQATGTFMLTIGSVELSRWHTYRRASDYAEERLFAIWQRGLQVPRRAELSRPGVGVFDALETNEYGHAKKARLVA